MLIKYNGQTIEVSENVTINLSGNCLEIKPVQTKPPAESSVVEKPIMYRGKVVGSMKVEHQTIDTKPLAQTVRSGNGHKSEKTRALSDMEKDHIRRFFEAVNGQIRPDACVKLHGSLVSLGSPDISIFQVTGFVTYLHGQAMQGLVTIRDFNRYQTYLQSHRALWAKYNSPRYMAMRAKNLAFNLEREVA